MTDSLARGRGQRPEPVLQLISRFAHTLPNAISRLRQVLAEQTNLFLQFAFHYSRLSFSLPARLGRNRGNPLFGLPCDRLLQSLRDQGEQRSQDLLRVTLEEKE